MTSPTEETCPCGHVVDGDGFCLIPADDEGDMHRVRRNGWICIDCAERVL